MDQEQQFDDDVMLQIALQMSMGEPSETSSTTAEVPADKVVDIVPSPEVETRAETADAVSPPEGGVSSPVTTTLEKEPITSSTSLEASGEETTTPGTQPSGKAAESSPKKKKKKKSGYAAMMAGVMAPTQSEEEKKKISAERIKAGMGGGEFSKLDKI